MYRRSDIDVVANSEKSEDLNSEEAVPEEEPVPDEEPIPDVLKPHHHIHIYGLKGVWSLANRNVAISLYDGYAHAATLRRNLSANALKGFKVDSNNSRTPAVSLCNMFCSFHMGHFIFILDKYIFVILLLCSFLKHLLHNFKIRNFS